MQAEEAVYQQIVKDSKQKILALELLANFFRHKDLFAALVRTKIIHNLFENNKELDTNKLELFHLQYTSSLIDLFKKLKKKKEQQYTLMSDELHVHEDMISRLQAGLSVDTFTDDMREHARRMSQKIQMLYQMLVTDKPSAFSWNDITNVSVNNRSEYYREISTAQYQQLSSISRPVYQNTFATFEKKLLGKLNIFQFRVKFLCGLCRNENIIEVYEFRDSNERFLFFADTKTFYLLDDAAAAGLDLSKNVPASQQVINELIVSTGKLKDQLSTIRTSIPQNVLDVLIDYVDKISSVDFVTDLQNVDEQTNILKSMLNIKIN